MPAYYGVIVVSGFAVYWRRSSRHDHISISVSISLKMSVDYDCFLFYFFFLNVTLLSLIALSLYFVYKAQVGQHFTPALGEAKHNENQPSDE